MFNRIFTGYICSGDDVSCENYREILAIANSYFKIAVKGLCDTLSQSDSGTARDRVERRVDCTRETIYRVEADKSARVRSTGTRGKFYKLSRVSFSGRKKAPFARSLVRSYVRGQAGVDGLLKAGETNEIGKSYREIG